MTESAAADAAPFRIEALPGTGRYTIAFRRRDGSEQAAVVEVRSGEAEVAEASLPAGWTRDSEPFRAVAAAVLAFDTARNLVPSPALRDVEGGWDVSLGNVVVDSSGAPACIAHGRMGATRESSDRRRFECAECGAVALLG